MILDYLKNNTKFTPSEQGIRDMIIAHSDYVTTMSISELAQVCHVSVASITRFCRKLGFQGYTDFKVAYIKNYKDIEQIQAYDKVTPFDKTSTYEDVLLHVPYIYEKTVNYMKMP